MKVLLAIFVIFISENFSKTIHANPDNQENFDINYLNKTLHNGRHKYHITTNIYINGNDAIFLKPIKHPNCPINDDPAKPIHLPYPGNCGKFYKCSRGYAYPMDCPAGLEWSIEWDRCDYPELAKCNPDQTTTLRTTSNPHPTTESEKPKPHPNCPANEDPAKPTHLPYPGNCGKFYKCSNGYAYPMDCPAGLEWSIKLDRCDYPEIAKCNPDQTTTLRTTSNPHPTTESEKPKPHPNCPANEDPAKPTHLPYPGNCGKFYKCSNGYAYPMDCPAGLEWSIEWDRCDYPEIAKCNPDQTTTLRTTSNPHPTTENEKPKPHPNCPANEDPAKLTHLPYPGNCGKFYKCSNGYAYPMDCPAGLEWSIELDRCDYPEIAKCNPDQTTTLRTTSNPHPTTESEKPKPHPNCPANEDPAKPTHLPYPGNCGKFYKCSNGYAYPMDCPSGLEWSIELDRCDYPEIAKCNPDQTTTLRTTSNPHPTTESEKPKPHPNCPANEDPAKPTHLPYPGNCGKFYKCSNGYAYPMDCPTGLEWSIELDRCDYPEIAKCNPDQTTTLRTTSNPHPTTESEKPKPHPNCPANEDPAKPTHLPYPGNCGKFYKCSNGYAYPMDCPSGLEWSIELDRCDYPEIAKCNPDQTTTLRTTSNPHPTTESEKPKPHPNCPANEDPAKPTHLPYPGNCGKFYKCSNGYAYPMDCPSGLEWSIELDRCDYPEIAKCNPDQTTTLRTTSTPHPTTESEKPKPHPNCPANEDPAKPTHLPYPGNCGKFYKCSNGYAYPMDCPAGLEWSIELDRCDYPEIAKCNPDQTTTLRTTSNPHPTTENEKPKPHPNCPANEDPAKPTHLPYPGNCGKFYKCSNGYAYPMDCPAGLEWSIELDRCDYPEIAKCNPDQTTTLRTTSNPHPTTESEKPKPHPNCPVNENPAKPTHLPYPGNCGKFYKCSNGYAYPMDCPSGLEWSIALDRCDYPEIAKCNPDATTTLKTTSSPHSTTECEKPKPHPNCPANEDPAKPTHLPYPGNCGKFYKCSYGYAYPMDCPAGLEWSIALDRCDYPQIAKCNPHITTTLRPSTERTHRTGSSTHYPNEEKPFKHPACPTFLDPDQEKHYMIYLPYPGKCDKYFKCTQGYAVPRNCPSGLHWSTKHSRCEWPNKANCTETGRFLNHIF